jgi:SAM-dependent methyltransferase
MTQIQSTLRRYISKVGLLPVAFFVWRGLRAWSPRLIVRNRAARKSSELPIPPNALIFKSTATREVEWFLRSGEETASAFRSALTDVGRPIESFSRVLDFGCGSGRVLRQWSLVRGPSFTGSDYNASAVEWVRRNLPFAKAVRNSLEPPLPLDAKTFDLCYAVSVFTHLPESLQRRWIEELHRVLAPNAILLLTLSGGGDFSRLTADEQVRFGKGELIVVDAALAGTNMCAVFHPVDYVRREWSDLFSLVRHYPSGAKGSPNQDLYVFRKIG